MKADGEKIGAALRGEMDEKELRALLHAHSARLRRRWGCVSDEQLAAFADGRLDGRDRAKVEKHLASCAACRQEIGEVVRTGELEEFSTVHSGLLLQAKQLAANELGQGSAPRWRWSVAASAVAAAVLVVTVLSVRRESPSPAFSPEASHPSVPSSGMTTGVPSAAAPEPDQPRSVTHTNAIPEMQVPSEGAIATSARLEFRWTPVQEALFYQVEVLTADGTIAWSGQVQTTHLTLAPQALLAPGKYFAWVRAHLRDGKTRKSRAVSFQISGER